MPKNVRGSLPSTTDTNRFTFLTIVCKAVSLEPTGFIPGSSISDSHANLKSSPKHRDGDSGSKVCKHNPQHLISLHPPSPHTFFKMFYSWTCGNLSVCWGAFSRRVNRSSSSLSLCSKMGVHILCLFLSATGPLEGQKHTPGTAPQTRRGAAGREQRALQPCEKLVLEKGVNPKAVPVQGLKKHQESKTEAKIMRLQWSSHACLRLHAYVGFHIYIYVFPGETWTLFIKITGFLLSLTSILSTAGSA